MSSATAAGWRYKIGFWMFTTPFMIFLAAPVIVPLVVRSPAQTAATIGAILLFAQLVWFASIPLLGQSGFEELKSKGFRSLAPAAGPISAGRHRLGTWLLGLAIVLQQLVLATLLIGYFHLGEGRLTEGLFGLSLDQEARIVVATIVTSVVLMVASIYCLGAPFIENFQRILSGSPSGDRKLDSS